MVKENTIKQENFDTLLRWLDHNRESAGVKYEKIRRRLIKIFASRGCFEAEELADATINRVTLKIPQIIKDYVGEPVNYFLGVANKVHHEWLKDQKKSDRLLVPEKINQTNPESEIEFGCLEDCLKTLSVGQRELIVNYYKREKGTHKEFRKTLAEKHGISIGNLRIKALRIRAELQECVRNCAAEKKTL